MIELLRRRLALLLLLAVSMPLSALDILVTNDDGATANLRALYEELTDASHDVLISVPCQNQSGQGAALRFLQPIGPLAKDCRGGLATTGAPGVGVGKDEPYIHYVDSTPVAALLYGLDVLAAERWGKAPDLVISGPNEGNNTGQVNPSSGTVSNAVYAINRGLPALAVSADSNTADNAGLAEEVARIVRRTVAELERNHRPQQGLLPAGTGLNINVPKFAAGEASALPFARTSVGVFSTVVPRFVLNLAEDPAARAQGIDVALPGITFGTGDPSAADPDSEALVLGQGKVTVSVIEGNFDVGPVARVRALAQLGGLFRPQP